MYVCINMYVYVCVCEICMNVLYKERKKKKKKGKRKRWLFCCCFFALFVCLFFFLNYRYKIFLYSFFSYLVFLK